MVMERLPIVWVLCGQISCEWGLAIIILISRVGWKYQCHPPHPWLFSSTAQRGAYHLSTDRNSPARGAAVVAAVASAGRRMGMNPQVPTHPNGERGEKTGKFLPKNIQKYCYCAPAHHYIYLCNYLLHTWYILIPMHLTTTPSRSITHVCAARAIFSEIIRPAARSLGPTCVCAMCNIHHSAEEEDEAEAASVLRNSVFSDGSIIYSPGGNLGDLWPVPLFLFPQWCRLPADNFLLSHDANI